MDAAEFAAALVSAKTQEDRIQWFGSLLSRSARTPVEIVGGSAIGIYLTSAAYVSEDVDVVGQRGKIEPVLQHWRFRRYEGRSHRAYWFHKALGLVDLVGTTDRSGLPPRTLQTPYGPVLVGAPEPLIIRRLVRASREGHEPLVEQAILLARLGGLDWEYLESEAGYEGIQVQLQRVRRLASKRVPHARRR